ncbi:unnamed protein product [Effrenium voratum]|nr:unnamed protein product [Effrenium voratum]CAJ1419666.1 unnamed protein product [Effrenium voratum]
MPVVPKKRITQYFARRRRLNFYMDHYRFLYKFRREHFDRRKYQEPLYVKDYSTPEFRFPGFWPGKFGYPHSQDQREQPLLESSVSRGEAKTSPRIMPGKAWPDE